MKRILSMVALLAWIGCGVGRAEGPDDQYVQIYNLIQEADQLNQTGQSRAAGEKYQQAQTALKSLQQSFPDWHQTLVQFRLNYLDTRLSQLAPTTPLTAPATGSATPVVSTSLTGKVLVEKPLPAGDKDQQIQLLSQEVQRLSLERDRLELKLREALAPQPALVDPRDVKIVTLEKENALLKVGLLQHEAKASSTIDPATLESWQKSLAEANRKLADQAQAITVLTQEKEMLQSRVSTPNPTRELSLLQTENEYLKRQLDDLRQKLQQASVTTSKSSRSRTAETSLAREESKQLKQLRQERDDLQKQLKAANEAMIKSSKPGSDAAKWKQLTNQLASLQSRLDAVEARKVPYTDEELAQLKKATPALIAAVTTPGVETNTVAAKRSLNDLPVGSGPLVAEAQRAFRAGRFDEAEQKYQQVLALDPNNVYTLGEIAVVQLQMNKLNEAETSLKKALSQEPNDAFNLSSLGYLKFLQGKRDEAFDALSRSIALDPKDTLAQNRLGIVLLERGQRDAAEAAFRKAIQLSPRNAEAHSNLAFVYATQNPPFVALARYHYQKALDLGQPRNPELEKILDSKKTAP